MSIVQIASALVMRELVRGAFQAVGGSVSDGAAQHVVAFLTKHFTDHSQKIVKALQTANDRAWRAVEIALAGDSWWDQLKSKVQPGEERAFGQQIQTFLQTKQLDGISLDRLKCLEQLRAARKRKLLDSGSLTNQDLTRQAGDFARFSDPTTLVQRESQTVVALADTLRGDYPHLAALLTIQARQGETLLAIGVRYFFRRAIEEDPQLAQGLAFARMGRLQQVQEQGFAALHLTFNQLGGRLESMLGEIGQAVGQIQQGVLDVHAELARQGKQYQGMYELLIAMQRKFDLGPAEIRPRDSLSVRSDEERRMVKQLMAQYRLLPEDRRRQMPALLNGLGKLGIAAGDFENAEHAFRSVAHLVNEPAAEAEARFNAYRAGLERRDWDGALRQLLKAVKLDASRFAPFPVGRYHPLRILGAGGFGVAFLCQHKQLQDKVVVKALLGTDLDRGVDMVLNEAKTLWKLEHPAIVRLSEFGYVVPATKSRPFFVMQFFDGVTLEEQVKRQPLAVEDLLAVAKQMVDGLQAAHSQGVLHRDVKPANLLVRREGESWQLKLIDFGLAISPTALQNTQARSSTVMGSSIAGTIDYAAPEQMGKLPGATVGPYSDVYGFGKTCCYALFGTPTPLLSHWNSIPKGLARLLEQCLSEDPRQRPADFEAVGQLLGKVRKPRKHSRKPVQAPDQLTSAAARLLAGLEASFDPNGMNALGTILGKLRDHPADADWQPLLNRAIAVAERATQSGETVFFSRDRGEIALPSLRAIALHWSFVFSLWK